MRSRARLRLRPHECASARVCDCMREWEGSFRVYICASAYMCTCVHVCGGMRTCVHVYMSAGACVHVCMCACAMRHMACVLACASGRMFRSAWARMNGSLILRAVLLVRSQLRLRSARLLSCMFTNACAYASAQPPAYLRMRVTWHMDAVHLCVCGLLYRCVCPQGGRRALLLRARAICPCCDFVFLSNSSSRGYPPGKGKRKALDPKQL